MSILVFNPNTSPAVTARIAAEVERLRRPGDRVVVRQAPHGPEVLESALDESRAVPYVVDAAAGAPAQGFAAVVIAAFCDPGLDAAREVASIGVYGLAETTCAVALTLGHRFGILTEQPHKVPAKWLHMRRLGLDGRCASVRAIGMGVQAIATDPAAVVARGVATARAMVERDGAEVIVLGCASMAGHAARLEDELQVPVLDPLAVTVKVVQGFVDLGLRHSKRALYRTPVTQRIQ